MKGNQMCDKCGGKGYYTEEVKEFTRKTMGELLDNVIQFATDAKAQHDAAETDTDALLILGTYLMISTETMNNNLNTVMKLTMEKMDDNPDLLASVVDRVVQRALKAEGRQN